MSKYTHGLYLFIILLLVILGIMAVRSALQEHDARIRMESTVSAKQQIVNDQAKLIKDAEDRIKDSQDVLAKTMGELERIKNQPPASPQATAEQIAQYLHIPSTPSVIEVPSQTPNAPPQQAIALTPVQAEQIRQSALACSENEVKLTACQEGQQERDKKIGALEEQVKVITSQRDDAISTAKGGTFWTRFKRSAKDIGIGLVVGGALGYAAHR